MSDLNRCPEQFHAPLVAEIDPSHRQELLHLVRTGKLPNGLLFSGAQGTGKSKAALFLAKACNCTGKPNIPCKVCGSCKKLDAGMHPDYICLDLEEGKKNISISQIRRMTRMISARPNEARYRVVCIHSAGQMNVQAQNALLKVLEAPPEQTFFILCADDGAPLLPTILSRCRKIRFQAASAAQVCQVLCQTHGMDAQTAHIAAHTMASDVDATLAALAGSTGEDPLWMSVRRNLIEAVVALMTGRAPKVSSLILSRHLSSEPDQLAGAMAVIQTFLRDLVLFRYHPKKIVNLDFFNAFEDISQMHSQETFLKWAENFHDTEKRLAANCGARLTLDRLFLTLSTLPTA